MFMSLTPSSFSVTQFLYPQSDGSKFRTPDVLTRYGTQPEIAAWLEVIASECGSRCTLMPFGEQRVKFL